MRTELLRDIAEKCKIMDTEPKRRVIIAIEGPVCAGKSTIVERLNQEGLGTILEYSEYVAHANQDFPKFPPTDEKVAKRSFEFFLNLEHKRYQNMSDLMQNWIAIDRSIFTLLAFEIGATKITGINIFDWAIARLKDENNLIIPSHIYYLDVPTATSRDRAERNSIPIPDFLLSNEFNQGFHNFFVWLRQTIPDYVTFIPASEESNEVLSLLHKELGSREVNQLSSTVQAPNPSMVQFFDTLSP